MRGVKIPKLSDAQARKLARAIAGFPIPVPDGTAINDSTEMALIKRALIVPSMVTGTFPSGTPYTNHIVSNLGIAALSQHLWNQWLQVRDI